MARGHPDIPIPYVLLPVIPLPDIPIPDMPKIEIAGVKWMYFDLTKPNPVPNINITVFFSFPLFLLHTMRTYTFVDVLFDSIFCF